MGCTRLDRLRNIMCQGNRHDIGIFQCEENQLTVEISADTHNYGSLDLNSWLTYNEIVGTEHLKEEEEPCVTTIMNLGDELLH